MLYQYRTFTCPSAGNHTDQKTWDRAFLSAKEFEEKYGKDELDAAQPQAE
jgi:hypothetical protein